MWHINKTIHTRVRVHNVYIFASRNRGHSMASTGSFYLCRHCQTAYAWFFKAFALYMNMFQWIIFQNCMICSHQMNCVLALWKSSWHNSVSPEHLFIWSHVFMQTQIWKPTSLWTGLLKDEVCQCSAKCRIKWKETTLKCCICQLISIQFNHTSQFQAHLSITQILVI